MDGKLVGPSTTRTWGPAQVGRPALGMPPPDCLMCANFHFRTFNVAAGPRPALPIHARIAFVPCEIGLSPQENPQHPGAYAAAHVVTICHD